MTDKTILMSYLNINYITNNIISTLNYFDRDDNEIDISMDMKETSRIGYCSYIINAKHDEKSISFRSPLLSPTTLNTILERFHIKQYVTDSAYGMNIKTWRPKDNNNIYTITLSNNREIEIEVPLGYSLVINEKEKKDTYSINLINTKNNDIEAKHIIDENTYIVKDIEDNTELFSLVDDNNKLNNIKFKFDQKFTNASSIIKYNPTKAIFYDLDKQYVMEYDEYGIMKSMIDISYPDDNLCCYTKIDGNDVLEIISSHPLIYDQFNYNNIPISIPKDITVVDRYVLIKDSSEAFIFTRSIFKKNNAVES